VCSSTRSSGCCRRFSSSSCSDCLYRCSKSSQCSSICAAQYLFSARSTWNFFHLPWHAFAVAVQGQYSLEIAGHTSAYGVWELGSSSVFPKEWPVGWKVKVTSSNGAAVDAQRVRVSNAACSVRFWLEHLQAVVCDGLKADVLAAAICSGEHLQCSTRCTCLRCCITSIAIQWCRMRGTFVVGVADCRQVVALN
jgi:hypothetical protein